MTMKMGEATTLMQPTDEAIASQDAVTTMKSTMVPLTSPVMIASTTTQAPASTTTSTSATATLTTTTTTTTTTTVVKLF